MNCMKSLVGVLLVWLFVSPSISIAETGARTSREQCLAHCARADAECGSAARAAKKQCARNAANNGLDPISLRRDNAALFCGYYSGNHCDFARHRGRCERRFSMRHDLCIDMYTKNTAQLYLACNDSERNAVGMCRQELGDCRASCE
jgi:hypothetical protein